MIYNREDFKEKADGEGGFYDFIFGYGVSLEDIDPEDTEFQEAVKTVLDLGKPFSEALEHLEELVGY